MLKTGLFARRQEKSVTAFPEHPSPRDATGPWTQIFDGNLVRATWQFGLLPLWRDKTTRPHHLRIYRPATATLVCGYDLQQTPCFISFQTRLAEGQEEWTTAWRASQTPCRWLVMKSLVGPWEHLGYHVEKNRPLPGDKVLRAALEQAEQPALNQSSAPKQWL